MPTLTDSPQSLDFGIGGTIKEYQWQWQGKKLTAIYEILGQGNPILLLPAFSTVSTRGEMRPIAELLASQFQVVALDWLGFGESSRLRLDYNPALYHHFLEDFVKFAFNTPITVIAAGHAAGYVMQLANSDVFSKIVLIAPTWRGPLPSMMGKTPKTFNLVKNLVRSPILGQALYKLNTTPSFLAWMYSRHVYADPSNITPDLIERKWSITQKSGARFAPAAFVTGGLDPFLQREDFIKICQSVTVPTMVIIGENVPPKSKSEMFALAELPNIQSQRLPGTLGLHEEYAETVVKVIKPFLTVKYE